MSHGWQMCALLVDHFGYSGKVEAQKMLERGAFENKRLLGAFNVDIDSNWMDFFTYTDFVDRDGEFQLQMFKYSAFGTAGAVDVIHVARKGSPHGNRDTGLAPHRRRQRGAGLADPENLNKWISSSYDLFWDGSFFVPAHWALRLGASRDDTRT